MDPRVGERENGHEHVARPRVQLVLEAFVGRNRGAHAELRRARELRGGLLAKRPRQRGGALEILARGRIGAGGQSHGQPGDHGVDARLEQRHPQGNAEDDRDLSPPFGRVAQREQRRGQAERRGEGRKRDVAGVHGGDHDEREQIVDDGERKQEDPQPGGGPRRQQRERAERERRVRRHRRAPPVSAGAGGVECLVDRHRYRHAAGGREHWDREAPALAQFSHVELTLGLQSHDEEEERHHALVDPVAKVRGQRRATQPNRERRSPHRFVGVRPRRVGPHQRDDRRREQHRRAAGLGAQEVAHRRGKVPRPRRAA